MTMSIVLNMPIPTKETTHWLNAICEFILCNLLTALKKGGGRLKLSATVFSPDFLSEELCGSYKLCHVSSRWMWWQAIFQENLNSDTDFLPEKCLITFQRIPELLKHDLEN